jgi:hypothetical protein
VFRDYKHDTEAHLNKCFEEDWKNAKIHKVCKDETELAMLKELIRSKYQGFRESYKFTSGIDPMKDLTSIGINTFSDSITSLNGFIDGKNMMLSDLDLEFISTNAGEKQSKRNPEKKLVRHNWIEIFVRLAVTRFVKKEKSARGPYQAMQIMFELFLDQYFTKFNSNDWRHNVLYTEENDLALKRSIKFLRTLYQTYSGRYAQPGGPKYMSLQEFQEVFLDCAIFNENFGSKQLPA